MAKILIIGTLDTKGEEIDFLRRRIEERGEQTLLLDVGIREPRVQPDLDRHRVARAAATSIRQLEASGDRGDAVAAMARGSEAVVLELLEKGEVSAVVAAGGSAGTTIACRAMRALPFGLPKVMVSTLASGDVGGFVGVKDIVMFPAIVDVSGLNRISRRVLSHAAAAVCSMTETPAEPAGDRRLVAATMFGNTTDCVDHCRRVLEKAGLEVLIFHATGAGGRTMEELVASGQIDGVLDVTTTEWADELVGGVMGAGPERLLAAARAGVPAVVVPGCLDMVNFWAPETVPEAFAGRLFYPHNPNVTLMRTTPDENRKLGEIFARQLNQSTGQVAVYIPTGGVSVVSAPGQPFHDAEADAAFTSALRRDLRRNIQVHQRPENINDPAFATEISRALIDMLDVLEKSIP